LLRPDQGAGVGALAGEEQRPKFLEVVLREEFPLGVLLFNGAECGRRSEHCDALVLGDYAPERAPYGAPQLSWFSRSPVYLFASHHIVGASTARMTIRHPDEPCRAGVFSALRLCHYPHFLGCSPPKHGSLRLLQAVASDKLLPSRRASNVAAFG